MADPLTRRPRRAALACVVLLGLLPLFGCGGNDERSRVPVGCLQGVPGVSQVTMQIGGFAEGAKRGLEAAVGSNVARTLARVANPTRPLSCSRVGTAPVTFWKTVLAVVVGIILASFLLVLVST